MQSKSQIWLKSQVSIFPHSWNMFKCHFCDLTEPLVQFRLLIYFINWWHSINVVFYVVWFPVCNKLQHCLYPHAESTSFLSLGFTLHFINFFCSYSFVVLYFPLSNTTVKYYLHGCCTFWSWNHFTVAVLYTCSGNALALQYSTLFNMTCCLFSVVLEFGYVW